jgi:hypothetical protein
MHGKTDRKVDERLKTDDWMLKFGKYTIPTRAEAAVRRLRKNFEIEVGKWVKIVWLTVCERLGFALW